MNWPNQEQVLAIVRWGFATFGPIVVSYGYVTSSGLATIMGAVISGIPLVWSMLTHTQDNAIAVVAAMKKDPASPVKGVILEQNIAGQDLSTKILNSNPDAGVAPAGTNAAVTMAQPKQGEVK